VSGNNRAVPAARSSTTERRFTMTKSTEKASGDTTKSARPKLFYISFGLREQDLLAAATPEELALYFHLKTRSNFKTGDFPKYKNDHQTFDTLAEALTKHDRKPRGTVEVQDILDRLTARGLVKSVTLTGERLTMQLPLSPLKPPPAAEPEPAAEPIVIGQPESDPPKVSINNKNNSFFYNTDSIVGAAVAAHCGAGAAVAMLRRVTLNPDQNPTPENQGENPAAAAWSVQTIMALVNDTDRFAYATTSNSQRFYQGWIDDGFEYHDITRAMNTVLANVGTEKTPAAIDRQLRGERHQPPCKKRHSGVVL
jgi:hypothetical protein